MNRFVKYLLIAIGANIGLAVLLLAPSFMEWRRFDPLAWAILSFLIFVISLFIQLVVGFTFIIREEKKEVGQAMLLTVGIFLLIGFSLCSM